MSTKERIFKLIKGMECPYCGFKDVRKFIGVRGIGFENIKQPRYQCLTCRKWWYGK